MRFIPKPPIVASTLSGFVVGVFVALIATGVVNRPAASSPTAAPLPVPSSVAGDQLRGRVKTIVERQLGPAYPGQRSPRLVALTLLPAASSTPPNVPTRAPEYHSVMLTIRLNDHPLGRSWRLLAAKGDVFRLLKALYTSSLPISDVEIVGVFSSKNVASAPEKRVMDARISQRTAERIPWRRWGRDRESQLWLSLNYRFIAPGFA